MANFENEKDSDKPTGLDFEEIKNSQDLISANNRSGFSSKRYGLRFVIGKRFERYLVERLPNLSHVGWFVMLWLGFFVFLMVVLLLQIKALAPYHTRLYATEGGVYTEGIVGRATNFNPIYATSEVDHSVTRLVFANLFDYDQDNRLQPVLAESLTTDEKAQQYTLTLKPGLKWHDGEPLDIDDVIFTIQTIQDPDARSPLRNNWEGVVVDRLDHLSLKFTLPASFSPFAANLVLAIIPQHLLASEDVKQLRNAPFNFQPVGSGPFEFKRLVALSGGGGADKREVRITLSRNDEWRKTSLLEEALFLEEFSFWVVPTEERLAELFSQGQISGAFNLDEQAITLDNADYDVVNLNLMNGVYLFFKNSSPYLNDREVRYALASALDVPALLKVLPQKTQRIFGPLLPEHDGYNLSLRPPQFDRQRARQLIQRAGWRSSDQGWVKDGQRLNLILTTQKDSPYEILAYGLKTQLAEVDINVTLDLRTAGSVPFEILQNHNYGDMLIYGLNLGGDADIYSYWHSSQIESNSTLRLNLAEYQSVQADEALDAGRSRSEPAIRRERYADFQKIWVADLPAMPLFRFQMTYYTLKGIQGPSEDILLINNSDRFLRVERWAVLQRRVSL